MNTKRIDKGQARMIAHRGVSGLETENTAASFVAAGNRSYWGVETDIHRTKDGELIVFHDDNTKRLTGVDRVIEETPYAELRAMRLFDRGTTEPREDLCMPSLREYIRICRRYEKTCVLELKNAMDEETVGRVVSEIREENYLDSVVFISFNTDNLRYIRRLCPQQTVQQLSSKMDEDLLALCVKEGFDLDIYYKALNADWIRRAHEAGRLVNCWTVDAEEDASSLIEAGIDFITSNILE